MKSYSASFLEIFLFGWFLLFANCKPDELTRVTKLQTGAIIAKTSNSATASATFIDLSGKVTDFGHCWSTTDLPTISNYKNVVSGIAQKGEYTSNLEGLTANTKYWVKAYALDGGAVIYGNVIEFKTDENKTISVISPQPNETWETGIQDTIKWTDNIDENVKIELYRGGNKLPDITTSTESDGIYLWTPDKNLIIGSDYSIKIISVNNANISGTSNNFSVVHARFIDISKPASGIIWMKGGSNLIEWTSNITENVNIELFKGGLKNSDIVLNTVNNQSYLWDIPKLLAAASDYSVKISSVSNNPVTGESSRFSLSETKPALTTNAITSISSSSAISGGNITSDGGAIITAIGICWGTSPAPTLSNHITSEIYAVSFVSNLTGLSPNTTYYVRAYATNNAGTSYGNEQDFITLASITTPVVSTTSISNTALTTATSGGNVTSDGGATVTSRGVCWNTTGNPSISNSKTNDGSGTGSFVSNITGLTSNTTYYVKAYATNSIGTSYGEQVEFKTEFSCGTRLTDLRDNKTYLTVQIGTQCWFAENLNVGTKINGASDQTDNSILEKYCYGDDELSCNLYGGLYQWDEMMQYSTIEMSRGVCPTGWHLPSDNEWKTLEISLGMDPTAASTTGWRGTTEGGKLKAAGTTYWDTPNTGATNSSLFTALPSGNRNSGGTFDGRRAMTDFWTSTLIIDTQCWYRYLDSSHSQIYRIDGNRKFGTPVRCVKD
jgi:uncharacterized protein (TIGR02145 family)